MIVMHYSSDGDVAYTVFTEMYTKISREKNIINARHTKNKTST